MFRVGFFQFEPRFGDAEANRSHVSARLSQVEADLVVLPELAFTGYLFESRAEAHALAEDPDRSPTVDALVELCRARGFHVATGFAERRGERVYNSALLVGPGGLVRTYRKLHLFNNEKRCFDPGDLPLTVDDVGGVRVGQLICFDWSVPEVARTLALQGADLLCHPANLVLPWGQHVMVTRCLENSVYAVTANRVGSDVRPHGTLAFKGNSQIIGPRAEIIFRAAEEGELLHVEVIDPARARDKRLTPLNHIVEDRRPELYYTAGDALRA